MSIDSLFQSLKTNPRPRGRVRRLHMSVDKLTRSRRPKPALTRVGIVALLLLAVALVLAQKHAAAAAQATASATQVIQNLVLVGISTIHSTPVGSGAVQNPEFANEGDFGDGGIKGAAVVGSQLAAAPRVRTRRFNRPIPSKEAARHQLAANTAAATANSAAAAAFPPPEPVVPSDFVVP